MSDKYVCKECGYKFSYDRYICDSYISGLDTQCPKCESYEVKKEK